MIGRHPDQTKDNIFGYSMTLDNIVDMNEVLDPVVWCTKHHTEEKPVSFSDLSVEDQQKVHDFLNELKNASSPSKLEDVCEKCSELAYQFSSKIID